MTLALIASLYMRLAQAEDAWGRKAADVSIVWSDLGPCDREGTTLSIAQPVDTTFTFDDGTKFTSRAWTISVNSRCDWEHRFSLDLAVLHEVGHTLGLGHSADRRSVMFKMQTGGKQKITKQDRQMLQRP